MNPPPDRTLAIRPLLGALDKSVQRDVVLALAGLIILRWADFQDAEAEAAAAFEGTRYEPFLPSSLHWRTWHDSGGPPVEHMVVTTQVVPRILGAESQGPLGELLRRAKAAFDVLPGLDPGIFSDLVRWLANQPFETPADRRALLATFDDLLARSAEKESGEFRTPPAVARLMVELAAPAPGERIYDPCMGSAGLLTAAVAYAEAHPLESARLRSHRPVSATGMEMSGAVAAIGIARLVLAGASDPQVEIGNSLERDLAASDDATGADLIITNPPFGMRVPRERMGHLPIPSTDATACFVQHCLAQIRPGGRLVMLVPHGFCFRTGTEARVREWLLGNHTIEHVVDLGERAFMPLTAIRAAVLVVRRGGSTSLIRMSEASRSSVPAIPGDRDGRGDGSGYGDGSGSGRGDGSGFGYGDGEGGGRGDGGASGWRYGDGHRYSDGGVYGAEASEWRIVNTWEVSREEVAAADFDLTPRRRESGALDRALESLRGFSDLTTLDEVCTISAGHNVPSEKLAERADDESAIGYVRIGDIAGSVAMRPSRWITSAAQPGIKPEWKLRSGEVLLSRSGTIGKVAVVTNGAVGCVASTAFFVLRPAVNGLDPHFLSAYLGSPEVKEWLDSRSGGSAQRTIQARTLGGLPLPLPPLDVQRRVASAHRDGKVAAVPFLMKILTNAEGDPVAEWLLSARQQIPELTSRHVDGSKDLGLAQLGGLVASARDLRNRIAHGAATPDLASAGWFIRFFAAIESLRGVERMAPSMTLYSLLRDVEAALAPLQSMSPEPEAVREIQRWLGTIQQAIRSRPKLGLSVVEAGLVAGEAGNVALRVTNDGPLTMRDIVIGSRPDWGSVEVSTLEPGATQEFSLRGTPARDARSLTLDVAFEGATFDGSFKTRGGQQFEIPVLAALAVPNSTPDLGGSPYVAGDPIKPERNDVFFGREELLDQIRRQIVTSGNVVLLEGNRRAGKSSILAHLEGVGPIPGWMAVNCNLQNAGLGTVEIFRLFARSIAEGLLRHYGRALLPNGETLQPVGELDLKGRRALTDGLVAGIREESSYSDFRDYLDAALDLLEKQGGLRLLLMLDEFDRLQEGIDNGRTSQDVPQNLRYLIQSHARLSAIITGSRRLKRMREEYFSVLFGLGTRIGVSALEEAAALRLVTEPVRGRLSYSQQAAREVVRLTAAQPFLLQSLCNRVFDLATQKSISSITLEDVQRAAAVMVEDNEHFASLWGAVATDRRRLLLWICHSRESELAVRRFEGLRDELSACGVEVTEERLTGDIEELKQLELLRLESESADGAYKLVIPLMGLWMARQHDSAVLIAKARAEAEDTHE